MKFWWLPWFSAQNNTCLNICNTVYVPFSNWNIFPFCHFSGTPLFPLELYTSVKIKYSCYFFMIFFLNLLFARGHGTVCRSCVCTYISFCGKYFAFKKKAEKERKVKVEECIMCLIMWAVFFSSIWCPKNLYSLFWQQENLFSVFNLGQTRYNSTEVEIKKKSKQDYKTFIS